MQNETINTNSLRAWMLAARPKTLTAAAVPVMVGGSLALYDTVASGRGDFQWWVLFICFAFAFVMQIDANFINDYFDFKKGNDDENRLGPRRACTMGWIEPNSMIKAIMMTTCLACLVGLPLLFVGGWQMLLIGLVCVVFSFLYTTHLSYIGLGDLLVIIFFGLIPVCATYYLLTADLAYHVVLMSAACGMIVDTLLVVNNYRDRDNDKANGKMTLAVRLGERATPYLYFILGLVACHCCIVFLKMEHYFSCFIPFNYLFFHAHSFRSMKKIKQGKALNKILGQTARNIFLFGILFTLGVMLDLLVM